MNAIKKRGIALLIVAVICAQLSAQSFLKNEIGLSAGIGPTNAILIDGDVLKMPPMTVSIEKGMADNISAGISIGYASTRSARYELLGDSYHIRYRYAWISARVAYYFSLHSDKKLRASTGFTLGWGCGFGSFKGTGELKATSIKYAPVIRSISGVFGSVQYRVFQQAWVFAELSWGGTLLQAGIALPLNESSNKRRYRY